MNEKQEQLLIVNCILIAIIIGSFLGIVFIKHFDITVESNEYFANQYDTCINYNSIDKQTDCFRYYTIPVGITKEQFVIQMHEKSNQSAYFPFVLAIIISFWFIVIIDLFSLGFYFNKDKSTLLRKFE